MNWAHNGMPAPELQDADWPLAAEDQKGAPWSIDSRGSGAVEAAFRQLRRLMRQPSHLIRPRRYSMSQNARDGKALSASLFLYVLHGAAGSSKDPKLVLVPGA